MVERARERSTLIVVTSDRALADYVRRCGAQVIRSAEFRKKMAALAAAAAESPDGEADEPSSQGELKQWMRYFGVAPEDDEEEAPDETL